jgi:hypothetical protein
VTDTAVLKRIGAPVMGLMLLYALFVFFRRLASTSSVATT